MHHQKRLQKTFVHLFQLPALVTALFWAVSGSAQTTFVVNSIGDNAGNSPGNGTCSTGIVVTFYSGNTALECTLRAAIEEANAAATAVNIDFHPEIEVNSSGSSRIEIGSGLPFITNQVNIRGQTHPDWAEGRQNIALLGQLGGADHAGLRFGSGSDSSRVENLGFSRFRDGIYISSANNLTITNNMIGSRRSINTISHSFNTRDGIRLLNNSSSNIITNNVIQACGEHGIHLTGGSDSNVIDGNIIGLRPGIGAGSPMRPIEQAACGGAGVMVAATAGEENIIGFLGGNTLSNNDDGAIQVFADNQIIVNNRIGLPFNDVHPDFTLEDYGNRGTAAVLLASSDNEFGTGTSTGNIVVSSQNRAVQVGLGGDSPAVASNNSINGNRIGLDEADNALGQTQGIRVENGTGNDLVNNRTSFNNFGIDLRPDSTSTNVVRNQLIGNTDYGIRVFSTGDIGSSSISDANVIGHSTRGIYVVNFNSSILRIRNNYIGTDANAADLGNTIGIQVQASSGILDIGGSNNGNIIGNNQSSGIFLASGATAVWVLGNHIGRHPNGTAIGNGQGIRVSGTSDAFENRIGFGATTNINPASWGPGVGSANIIAHSAGAGIDLAPGGDDAIRNTIRGNSIFANGGRGIDLGMSQIDSNGAANGPNRQMNWPEFDGLETRYNPDSDTLDYRVRVRTSAANADYPLVIDFFLTDGQSNQGRTFLGSFEYDTANEWTSGSIPWPSGKPTEGRIVATATDQPGETYANTSQFTAVPAYIGSNLATAPQDNGPGGVFLDLEAISDELIISGFDVPIQGDIDTLVDIVVLVRSGSYEGFADDPDAWTMHTTVSVFPQDFANTLTAIDLDQIISIPAGATTGVYLQALSSGGIRYTGTSGNPPQTTWSNDDIILFSDTGTTADEPFGGNLFSPRAFSGLVRYSTLSGDRVFEDRFQSTE